MIFHFPGVLDAGGNPVASQIRPAKMLAAFQALGYDVYAVLGTVAQRARLIDGVVREIKAGKRFEFLYSENHSLPTLLTTDSRLPLHLRLDYRLFSIADKAAVPLGVFYRDIYWRFPEYRNRLGWAKTLYLKFFLYLDLWTYIKRFDAMFVPSLAMLELFPRRFRPRNAVALPPGADAECVSCPRYSGGQLRLLYVGGIGYYYDLENIWNAVLKLPESSLTICCRKYEWQSSEVKKWLDRDSPDNIQIVHLSGEKLEELYRRSHLLVMTVGSHSYRAFAMPFKLFEYIAHRGPIICAADTAAAGFASEKGAGFAVEDSSEAIRKKLMEIIRSPEVLLPIYENLEALPASESWTERAKLVARSLSARRR